MDNWSDAYSSERRKKGMSRDSGVVQIVVIDILFWGAIILLFMR